MALGSDEVADRRDRVHLPAEPDPDPFLGSFSAQKIRQKGNQQRRNPQP
jgi:hypothetical protein